MHDYLFSVSLHVPLKDETLDHSTSGIFELVRNLNDASSLLYDEVLL